MVSPNRQHNYLCLGVVVSVICVAAWLGVTLLLFLLVWFKSEQAGQVGDAFGAVNALFSALAFAGVIIAILMQRRELQLQREELEQTRAELKGQKESLVLTAFLNAQTAIRETESLHHLNNAQWDAYERLEQVVAGLQPEVERIIGRPITTTSQRLRCGKRLRNAATEFLAVWPSREGEWLNLAESTKEPLRQLKAQIEKILQDVDPSVKNSVEDVLRDVIKLLAVNPKQWNSSNQYEQHHTAGRTAGLKISGCGERLLNSVQE